MFEKSPRELEPFGDPNFRKQKQKEKEKQLASSQNQSPVSRQGMHSRHGVLGPVEHHQNHQHHHSHYDHHRAGSGSKSGSRRGSCPGAEEASSSFYGGKDEKEGSRGGNHFDEGIRKGSSRQSRRNSIGGDETPSKLDVRSTPVHDRTFVDRNVAHDHGIHDGHKHNSSNNNNVENLRENDPNKDIRLPPLGQEATPSATPRGRDGKAARHYYHDDDSTVLEDGFLSQREEYFHPARGGHHTHRGGFHSNRESRIDNHDYDTPESRNNSVARAGSEADSIHRGGGAGVGGGGGGGGGGARSRTVTSNHMESLRETPFENDGRNRRRGKGGRKGGDDKDYDGDEINDNGEDVGEKEENEDDDDDDGEYGGVSGKEKRGDMTGISMKNNMNYSRMSPKFNELSLTMESSFREVDLDVSQTPRDKIDDATFDGDASRYNNNNVNKKSGRIGNKDGGDARRSSDGRQGLDDTVVASGKTPGRFSRESYYDDSANLTLTNVDPSMTVEHISVSRAQNKRDGVSNDDNDNININNNNSNKYQKQRREYSDMEVKRHRAEVNRQLKKNEKQRLRQQQEILNEDRNDIGVVGDINTGEREENYNNNEDNNNNDNDDDNNVNNDNNDDVDVDDDRNKSRHNSMGLERQSSKVPMRIAAGKEDAVVTLETSKPYRVSSATSVRSDKNRDTAREASVDNALYNDNDDKVRKENRVASPGAGSDVTTGSGWEGDVSMEMGPGKARVKKDKQVMRRERTQAKMEKLSAPNRESAGENISKGDKNLSQKSPRRSKKAAKRMGGSSGGEGGGEPRNSQDGYAPDDSPR